MSQIKDLSLAPSGADKIAWVASYMPILNSIKAEFEKIKASDPYLFADVTVPRVTGKTEGLNTDASGKNQRANDALRAMFGKGNL